MSSINPIEYNSTELQGDLKNYYTDVRTQLFPISTPLMSLITKAGPGGIKNMNWMGTGVFFDIVTNPPTNWGFSGQGYLPRSSQQTEVQGSSGIKRFYVNRAFDNLVATATRSKEGAFATLRQKLTEEFDGAMSLGVQMALQGNALGILGVIGTASTTTSIIVSSPYGVSGAGQGGLWIQPSQYIAVLDSTGATLRGKAVISAVSNSGDNATLTLATAIAGMTATDIIVLATDSDTSYNQYTNGLINITNRGGSYASLHGQSASVHPRWNTINFSSASDVDDVNNPNELDAWTLAAKVGAVSGKRALQNPKEFVFVAPYTLQKKFIASTLTQRNVQVRGVEKVALPGGYEAEAMFGVPFIPDEYTPAGTFYMLHRPSLAWVDAADWQPVQYDGAPEVRPIEGRDAFSTAFRMYWNLVTTQRNAHGAITVYTDTQRISPVM